MKVLLSISLLTLGINCYSQLDLDSSYNKCLKSVINIEVRSTNQKVNSIINKEHYENKISETRFRELRDSLRAATPAYTGTAIFLEDKGKHFLLTVRHVVIDQFIDKPWDSNLVASAIILIENDTLLNPPLYLDFNLAVNENYRERMLWFYGAHGEGYKTSPYIMSSAKDDLAILCIDCDTNSLHFYKTLVDRGYVPLSTRDIDSAFKVKRGDNIYSIGFPENSQVGRIKLPGWHYPFTRSSIVSIPVLTLGVFQNEFPTNSIFFDAKMFVYHGFSGAPVMNKNKLIGIVSGGEFPEFKITGEKIPFKYLIHNHSKFIKSSAIFTLLKTLQQKIKDIPPPRPRNTKSARIL